MAQNKATFEDLYTANYKKLYQLAFRLTGKKEDAEDLLQESFLRAFNAYNRFEGRSAFSTWMYKIVVNCSARFIKRQRSLPLSDIANKLGISESALLDSIKTDEAVDDLAMVNDLRESCLQMFLNCMPRQQKIAFVLKIILGLSIRDVSQIMSISESSVKVNVYRARQNIKNNLDGKCSLINPNNPCQCTFWVIYATKTGRMNYLPKLPPMKHHDYNEIFNSEMNFLNKLSLLYISQPGGATSSEFIGKMKDIISQENLKILS